MLSFLASEQSQIESVPGFLVDRLAYEHWIDGAYLITKVEADDGIVRIPVTEDRLLDNIRRRLNEDLTISFRGKKLRVSAAGSLEGVGEENLQDALAALVAPALIVLEPLQPSSCADDHIAAVNLTRPVQVPPDPKLAEELIAEVRATHPGCVQVKVGNKADRGGRGPANLEAGGGVLKHALLICFPDLGSFTWVLSARTECQGCPLQYLPCSFDHYSNHPTPQISMSFAGPTHLEVLSSFRICPCCDLNHR